MDILLIIIAAIILWLLHKVLEELRTIRILLELPSRAKKSYDEQLNKLDDEIKSAFALMLVTPAGEKENARKAEFTALVKKQKEVLEEKRKHFYVRPKYLNKR